MDAVAKAGREIDDTLLATNLQTVLVKDVVPVLSVGGPFTRNEGQLLNLSGMSGALTVASRSSRNVGYDVRGGRPWLLNCKCVPASMNVR